MPEPKFTRKHEPGWKAGDDVPRAVSESIRGINARVDAMVEDLGRIDRDLSKVFERVNELENSLKERE